MVVIAEAAPASARARLRMPPRRVLWLVAAAALLAVGFEASRVMLGSNFHTVVPGRIYRCAQPSTAALDQIIAEHGIRTVVNLRGTCDPFDWYLDEARAAH